LPGQLPNMAWTATYMWPGQLPVSCLNSHYTVKPVKQIRV
jgi:hypothetical protein